MLLDEIILLTLNVSQPLFVSTILSLVVEVCNTVPKFNSVSESSISGIPSTTNTTGIVSTGLSGSFELKTTEEV